VYKHFRQTKIWREKTNAKGIGTYCVNKGFWETNPVYFRLNKLSGKCGFQYSDLLGGDLDGTGGPEVLHETTAALAINPR